MLLISSLYLRVFSGYHFSDFSSNRRQSIYNTSKTQLISLMFLWHVTQTEKKQLFLKEITFLTYQIIPLNLTKLLNWGRVWCYYTSVCKSERALRIFYLTSIDSLLSSEMSSNKKHKIHPSYFKTGYAVCSGC